MNCKVMWTVHAFVHHEDTGLNSCAFARSEYHRTDGQLRRSASLEDFDVWLILEAQCSITRIGDLDLKI